MLPTLPIFSPHFVSSPKINLFLFFSLHPTSISLNNSLIRKNSFISFTSQGNLIASSMSIRHYRSNKINIKRQEKQNRGSRAKSKRRRGITYQIITNFIPKFIIQMNCMRELPHEYLDLWPRHRLEV